MEAFPMLAQPHPDFPNIDQVSYYSLLLGTLRGWLSLKDPLYRIFALKQNSIALTLLAAGVESPLNTISN